MSDRCAQPAAGTEHDHHLAQGVQRVGVRRLAQHYVQHAEPLSSHADGDIDSAASSVTAVIVSWVMKARPAGLSSTGIASMIPPVMSTGSRAQHEQVVVGHQDVDGGRARRGRQKAAYDGEQIGRERGVQRGQQLGDPVRRRQPLGHAGGLSVVSVEAHPSHCP